MERRHIFGPPGTGKTTALIRQVKKATEKYEPSDLVVCSFTRAAAEEVRSRNPAIEDRNVGTIHSLARGLRKDARKVAEDRIEEWNKWVEAHGSPEFIISRGSKRTAHSITFGGEASVGDRHMGEMNLHRSRRHAISPKLNSGETLRFSSLWKEWKEENELIDFTDMLEDALDIDLTPGGATGVLFVDEAQDMDALQATLVNKWARRMDHLALFGDDDQCIYTWAGADAQHMIGVMPDHDHVLSQSYRLPRSVHAKSTAFIARWVSPDRRREKAFKPRDFEGYEGQLDANVQSDAAGVVQKAWAYAKDGHSVMILTSCGFMLRPVIDELRDKGIPYHNPYRIEDGSWNPLRFDGKSTTHRVWCFAKGFDEDQWDPDFGPSWTGAQMARWVELLNTQTGVLTLPKKEILMQCEQYANMLIDGPAYMAWFNEDPFEDMGRDLRLAGRWLTENALKAKKRATLFPLQIARKQGLENLRQKPNIVVGTIHSVKGAQADVVIMAPDISNLMASEIDIHEPRTLENMARVFYVGMTRAKQALYITAPPVSRRGNVRYFPGLY